MIRYTAGKRNKMPRVRNIGKRILYNKRKIPYTKTLDYTEEVRLMIHKKTSQALIVGIVFGFLVAMIFVMIGRLAFA